MPEDGEILAGLYGLRETAPGLADIAAALALGLLAAMLIRLALRPFLSRPRPSQTFAQRITETETLPEPERPAALARLLREITDRQAPGDAPWTERAASHFGLSRTLMADLSTSLYRPDPGLDLARLTRAANLAARRSRR